jgi:hypothetical protein
MFSHQGPVEKVVGFRRRSDRDTRLMWIEHSVKPAVRWLLDNGDRAEVLAALGLTPDETGHVDI